MSVRAGGSSSSRSLAAASSPGRGRSLRQLSGVDALHVLEETRDQHMHTIKVAVLARERAGQVTIDAVHEWLQERVLRIPPMRWRVLKIPFGLGRPVFVDAGPVEVDRHLQ